MNMVMQATNGSTIFLGISAAAFAALESSLIRHHRAALLIEASGARPAPLIALRRLAPTIVWFSLAHLSLIVSAVLIATDSPQWRDVAAVSVAGLGVLAALIGWGALLGRFLPLGLGPILAAITPYLVYVPAAISEGRGLFSHVPVMDSHPAPWLVVRPGVFLLAGGAAIALAAVLLSLCGAALRLDWTLAAAAAVAASTGGLISVHGDKQEDVFFALSPRTGICVDSLEARLCVLPSDERYLKTLVAGVEMARPALDRVEAMPSSVLELGVGDQGSADAVAIDPVQLAVGREGVAAQVIAAAVTGPCDQPAYNPATMLPWEGTIAAVLHHDIGLPTSYSLDTEAVEALLALDGGDRVRRLKGLIAAVRACQGAVP